MANFSNRNAISGNNLALYGIMYDGKFKIIIIYLERVNFAESKQEKYCHLSAKIKLFSLKLTYYIKH